MGATKQYQMAMAILETEYDEITASAQVIVCLSCHRLTRGVCGPTTAEALSAEYRACSRNRVPRLQVPPDEIVVWLVCPHCDEATKLALAW